MIYNITPNLRVIDSTHGWKIQKSFMSHGKKCWRNDKHPSSVDGVERDLRSKGFGEEVIAGLRNEIKAAEKRLRKIAAGELKRFRLEVV